MPKKIKKPVSVLLRAAFIGCLIVLAILAWLPGAVMTRTMLGAHPEHFVAYLGTAIFMGLTFQRSPRPTMQSVLLIMYAAALEAGQLYSPGRHASLQDFAYSVVGIVAGGLLLSMARTRVSSWLRLD
jgi:VanZ family protein